jgi:hypothetical protein
VSHRYSHHPSKSKRDDLRVLGPLLRDFEAVSEVNVHHSPRHSFEHEVRGVSVTEPEDVPCHGHHAVALREVCSEKKRGKRREEERRCVEGKGGIGEIVERGQEGRGEVGIKFMDCKCNRGKCNIIDQSRIAHVQCIERNLGVTNDTSNRLVSVDRLSIKMTNNTQCELFQWKRGANIKGTITGFTERNNKK